MAENRRSPITKIENPPDEPLLRPGRSADPNAGPVAGEGTEASPDQEASPVQEPSPNPQATAGEDAPAGEATLTAGIEKTIAESRQRKLRLMLRQCDRVMLMDFEILAMADWPDNYTLAVAQRSRDLWLLASLLAAVVFLSGLTGLVPAWIAGSGFGAFVLLLLAGLPSVRSLLTRKPSYLDLSIQRRRMLRDARKHIQHLEGSDGLLWQCAHMAEFNTALRAMRFGELRALSERRVLAKHMTRREHVRLYLVYMMEAEKAYSRAEKAFFERHQVALDRVADQTYV